MKEKKLIPKRRFKEFENDEAWEQRKLVDLGNIVTGSTPLTSDETNYGGDYLFVSPADIQENRYVENTITTLSEKGFKKGRILKEGSTLFVSIGSTIGKVAQIKGLATTNQQINSIEPTEKYNDDFVYSLMKNKAREIKLLAATQAVPIINKTLFSQVSITVPSNINEQDRIGSFFKDLDNLITLHQRKLKKLKETKSAYLSEMFPKEGEKYPKRRFDGFTDPWEQRKLGKITESFSGGTPSVGNSQYYGGTIPFIRSGEISSDKTELFVTEAALNNSSAKMVKIGDVLYALYGATSGEVSISRINGAINQAILAIRSTRNDDHYLIGQWLRIQKKQIISTYLQGGQGNLSGSIVKELMIALPADKEEQKLISSFLSNLDNLITLHQRKLEKLENLKKAYLNEMFV